MTLSDGYDFTFCVKCGQSSFWCSCSQLPEFISNFDSMWREAQETDVKLFGERDLKPIVEKLLEEAGELANPSDDFNELEEYGDLLFVLASYARVRKINPAHALSMTISKLRDRSKQSKKKKK